ncbi:glycoside hydrolase family 18 protein [Agrocybe pediades]|nr:glycoside hydrolase family 18 protein [Agrocybe pediades]
MTATVLIANHTTASIPRPHIVYTVEVTSDGKEFALQKRYSEFVALHEGLKDPFNLPPKRLLSTTFIPSAWVDDQLIAERKIGLAEYLYDVLSSEKYKDRSLVWEFLSGTPQTSERDMKYNLEDSLPSTLTRKKALELTSGNLDGEVNAQAVMLAAAYYPDWSASARPPEGLDFSKFDILFFAFGTPSSSNTLNVSSGSQAILKRLVSAARGSGYGTRVVISIGGWGGCYYFSQAASTAANRTKFVASIGSFVNTFNLDGVDLDWEFPNSAGAGQPYSAADSANLLSLFKALRVSLGPCKIISAAVSHTPWLGSNGRPLTDVSAYAKEMDYICIMNYDVWGASSTPGPNAPMADLCKTSKQPTASAAGALAAWSAAKFPASKMLLGIALYGYVSKSSKTVLTGSSMPSPEMVFLHKEEKESGDGKVITSFLNGAHPNTGEPDGEMKAMASLTGWWGKQIPFNEIVKAGALQKRSDGNYGQAGGFTMGWDDCSNTPYLFNQSQTTVVTYDDTWSITDKAKLAKSSGMAGCFTWSLDQDDGYTLHNAMRKGLGLK